MKLKNCIKKIAVTVLAAVCLCQSSVFAAGYQTYTYNAYEEPVYSADMYKADKVLTGKSIGTGALNEPADITVGNDSNFYIVDSKNNRIIKLNKEFELIKIFESFRNNETDIKLNTPKSVFVNSEGVMYISDYGNKRIVIADSNADVLSLIEKPKSDLFPQKKEFLPMDIAVTQTGTVYVLCDGIYQGAIIFDENSKFLGFFGSNTVEPTLKVITDYFWKKIATKEQRSKMSRYVPVQYSSLAIDSEDFVYVCVASAKQPSLRVKKLNPLGNNVLEGNDGRELIFGDPKSYDYKGSTYNSVLQSIDVCENGVFATLDRQSGKVFVYGPDGDLLCVLGAIGNQKGTFTDAVSLTFIDDKIAVLDAKKGEITLFSITEYGNSVLKALEVYSDGRYAESLNLWKDVLKYNSNSYLGNLGYGKALFQIGEYKESMKYFKTADEKQRYSEAYKEYRNRHLRENYIWYFSALGVFIILAVICVKFKLFTKLFKSIKTLSNNRKEKKSHEIQ